MKASQIVNKMKSHICTTCNQIHLTDFTHSPKGGTWQSVQEKDFTEVMGKIERGELNEETSGWKKHLDRWESEGKISKEDRS